MKYLKLFYEINEDSATGGPVVSGGAGAVVSAQPSGLAGQTIGQNWASNGGVDGSGDVGIPYNPSGSNRVFQKLPMGKGHGPRTGRKSREKKLDLKSLRATFDKKKRDDSETFDRPKKVMKFDDFSVRKDITSVKRLSESLGSKSEGELPRVWQIKAIAGSLNSYHHIEMTDDEVTFDFHMGEQKKIEEKLKGITCKELYELYFLLNENGLNNLKRLFSFVFNSLEKEHISNPGLNIWDFRSMKKLYYQK